MISLSPNIVFQKAAGARHVFQSMSCILQAVQTKPPGCQRTESELILDETVGLWELHPLLITAHRASPQELQHRIPNYSELMVNIKDGNHF